MKRFSILILTLCLCLTGCGKQTTEATAQIFAMDTVMEVAAYGPKAEKAVQETEGQIKALENQLSRTKADSDVSRVNHNGTTPTTGLTYGMRALLPAALEYRDATNGAFDITIAPVMDAWGFTGDSFRVPERSELDELLKHVNSGAEVQTDIINHWETATECQKSMYYDALPKQVKMLSQSRCLILPLFRGGTDLMAPRDISSLNSFASIWCLIQNILLAATAEGLSCALRIPIMNEEAYVLKTIHAPEGYRMPCYLAAGYSAPDARIIQQQDIPFSARLHAETW